LFYIATCDCTGHGVPGAFMSMLNISFLNENVIERNIKMPDEILNAQRTEIIKALNPKGNENSKDGMDCVLCAYDFEKMQLKFAGAYNQPYIVRSGELLEFKGDRMSVGKHERDMESFTLRTIELQKGDVVYTFTDGYPDQFGTSNKKLKSRALKEMLVKIYSLSMQEQKQYLDNFIEDWKGSMEQTDDILVIGVKIE
jgi:serine phosphatase RsbU (regulator of sigma subunit)